MAAGSKVTHFDTLQISGEWVLTKFTGHYAGYAHVTCVCHTRLSQHRCHGLIFMFTFTKVPANNEEQLPGMDGEQSTLRH